MLAPGEYLTSPPPAPQTGSASGPTGAKPEPPAPVAAAKEPEMKSFLLKLLGALGAIHS